MDAAQKLATEHSLPACAFWDTPIVNINMYDWQAGCCAFCGYPDRLVRDHDHDSGLIRGLLCPKCNVREGFSFSSAWDAYRSGVNPASILAQHEVYTPL